jgi:beta-glucosidase
MSSELRVRFRVTNTGRRTGTETARAYVELPASEHEPSKRLLGWQQVTLAPGQSRTVKIRIGAADLRDLHLLQYWNPRSGRWTTAPGRYEVTVGTAIGTTLADRFTIHRSPMASGRTPEGWGLPR